MHILSVVCANGIGRIQASESFLNKPQNAAEPCPSDWENSTHLAAVISALVTRIQSKQSADFSYSKFVFLPFIRRPIGRPPLRNDLAARAAPKLQRFRTTGRLRDILDAP